MDADFNPRPCRFGCPDLRCHRDDLNASSKSTRRSLLFGLVTPPMADPYTQTQSTTPVPVHKESISPEVMKAQQCDSWSWQGLSPHHNAVLLSNSKEFTGGIQITQANDLPRWQQSYVPQYAAWSAPELQWGQRLVPQAPQIVPHMNAPQMVPHMNAPHMNQMNSRSAN